MDFVTNLRNLEPKVIPPWARRWLGFREPGWKPNNAWYIKYGSIFFATMAAMLANEAVAMHSRLLHHKWHVETLVPSFAASCVLIYGSVQAPFSQPRNLIFGHFISALIGVCIMKLFMTGEGNEKYLWLSGCLSVALASVLMELTGTVHPPSGATALLPSVDDSIRRTGWYYLPLMLIHSALFLGIALLCDNIFRRYPFWWISPPSPPAAPAPVTPPSSGIEPKPGLTTSECSDVSTHYSHNAEPNTITPNHSTHMEHSQNKRTASRVIEIPDGFILTRAEENMIAELTGRLTV